MLLDWPARIAISPVLVAQALMVRRTAQLLPEAAGARSGITGNGPPLRLRIIGDSSAAGVGVHDQKDALIGQVVAQLAPHFKVEWQLDALTGATTRSTLAGLKNADAEPADIIITALGVNDVTRLIPAQKWRAQQTALLARLHRLYQPRMIYVSGIAPVGHFPLLPHPLRWTLGRHANALLAVQTKIAQDRPDVTLVPFDQPLDPALMASDGFHPSAAVYALWAKEMTSRIISDWPTFQQS